MLDWVQNTPLFTTSQLYFLLEKEVNRKINSLWTFYSKELKKNFRQQEVESQWMTPLTQINGSISLELIWLVCFKLVWLCKHQIGCYSNWFRKCVKLIWPGISGFNDNADLHLSNLGTLAPEATCWCVWCN